MKRIFIALIIIAGVFSGIYAVGNRPVPNGDLHEVSVKQITQNMKSGARLIDVRTPEEYAAGHAVGAINLPLDKIQNGQMPDAAKDQIVYLYCRSGHRAGEAKTILEKAGYLHVISITSLDNWKSMGGQTI